MEIITIAVDSLAEKLGKVKELRTLPNGRQVEQLCWIGADLARLDAEILRPMSSLSSSYVLDGPAPAWLSLAVIHGLHPQSVSLMDPRLGQVGVVGRKPVGEGEGKNLKFSTIELDEFTLVEFEIEGGTFDVADLDSVVAPAVNTTKGVIISGRGPNWLSATVGMAYHTARWVACWQPGSGATVAMTHHASGKLGSVIADEVVQAARQ